MVWNRYMKKRILLIVFFSLSHVELYCQNQHSLLLESLHFFKDGTVIAKWDKEIKSSIKEMQVVLSPLILVDSLWFRIQPSDIKVISYTEPAFLQWQPHSFTAVLNAYKGKKVDVAINLGSDIEEFEGYLYSFFPEVDPRLLCLLVEGNRLQCFQTHNITFILPIETDSISYAFTVSLEKSSKNLHFTYYGKWVTPHPWQWKYGTTVKGKQIYLDKYIQITFPSRLPAIKARCYFYDSPFLSEDSLGRGYVWESELHIASGISATYYVDSELMECRYRAQINLPPVSKFSPAGPGVSTLINFQKYTIDTLYCDLKNGKSYAILLEEPLMIEDRERIHSTENGDTIVVGDILFQNSFSDPVTLDIRKQVNGVVLSVEDENIKGKQSQFSLQKDSMKEERVKISFQYRFQSPDEKAN